LRSSYYGNAARNAIIFTELRKVLTTLREKDIEMIALKGAALGETVYGQRALRSMADIDLLVRKETLSRVGDLLVLKGYYPDRNNEGWLEHHYHCGFFKTVCATKVHFEIYWNVEQRTRPFKIDIDGMWERALPANIAGVEVFFLSPEDLLLYLCHHACKHKLNGIRPLCDIRETIRYYDQRINWEEIKTRSFQWRITLYVYLTLSPAKELLNAEVPESVLSAIHPEGLSDGLVDSARERVLGSAREKLLQDNARIVSQFWSIVGLKDRLTIMTGLFSPKALAKRYWIPSGSMKIYLYYPLLLKDLCARYLPILWCLFRGDQELIALAEQANNSSQLSIRGIVCIRSLITLDRLRYRERYP
jgi:hypothetical protein